VATVDRFSRSIRQTTRFHARKCLLGVSMMNFHNCPPFSPIFENLHYGLWQLWTAITRASLKIEARYFHQSEGFRGRQFNGVVEISLRPTLVTMVTNWWFSNTKLAKSQLKQERELQMLHQTGGFQGQFNGVVEIYFRLPLLPWQRNCGNFKTKLAITRPM